MSGGGRAFIYMLVIMIPFIVFGFWYLWIKYNAYLKRRVKDRWNEFRVWRSRLK